MVSVIIVTNSLYLTEMNLLFSWISVIDAHPHLINNGFLAINLDEPTSW